jgi:hypothetical protein
MPGTQESAKHSLIVKANATPQTVGLAGGYIAGGGHSPMSSLVGMAADQVS